MLPVLVEQPHAGYNEPFAIYLTCYRVLTATGDERAVALLQQGYALLQQDAVGLDDETRQCFLTAVPTHHDLVLAYRAWWAQADGELDGPAEQQPSNLAEGACQRAGAR